MHERRWSSKEPLAVVGDNGARERRGRRRGSVCTLKDSQHNCLVASLACAAELRDARPPPDRARRVPADKIPPTYKPGDLSPCVPVEVVRSSRLVIGMIPGII